MLDQVLKFLTDNGASIGTGLGIVSLVVGKFASTEKATGIVKAAVVILDGVAKACAAVGAILSKAIASDGILGKK